MEAHGARGLVETKGIWGSSEQLPLIAVATIAATAGALGQPFDEAVNRVLELLGTV